jgi:2-(1,2-epoxy-1,2-dihydrophenyl)acetyl-CoA isomerase
MDPAPLLQRHADDGVLWLTLNRPAARNAINFELRGLLRDALLAVADDRSVRVVVLQGDATAFCAGGDVKEMGGGADLTAGKLTVGGEIVRGIAELDRPVVAAVRGHAAGAGFSLALACDLIVADSTAQFRASFVGRGLVPDMGGTYWLARQVGLHRAKDIFLTGRVVDAAEALELGFVSRLFETAEFDDELDRLVSGMARGPVQAMGATKQLLNEAWSRDLASQLDAEAAQQVALSGTEEHRRAVLAFASSPRARA